MDDDGLAPADFIAQFLNFSEFPLLKLLFAVLLALASWVALREIFDKRMAEMRWIGNGLFAICALGLWYLILTLLLGYESAHGLFERVNAVLTLVIDGIGQLFHGGRRH